jgi:hypothetical protein
MGSNDDDKSFNNLSAYGQEEINKTITREKIVKEVEENLTNNPRYKEFFGKYSTSSVKSFIDSYKSGKANWTMWGETFSAMEQEKILKYSTIANNKLWEIQQKKLFNLQCRWRAETIKIPQITISYEFMYWEKLIEQCPFLPPISENEYDLYREFIISEGFENDKWQYYEWQAYNDYKASYNNEEGREMPEWYEFYDQRMGTGSLLLLPNVRGEKEDFYLKLFYEDQRKQKPELYNVNNNIDDRPYLNYYDSQTLELFVETFESLKIRDAYRAMRSMQVDSLEYNEDLSNAVEILKQAGNIELCYAGNWRESLLKTARNYEKEKIHEALSTAYRNYLNRLKMGIGFNNDSTEDNTDFYTSLIAGYKERILKGRALNGEPEDFNF